MPTQETITERYWCPGGWPWEWARMCTRTVTKWCYHFQWLKEHRFGLFCYLEGCENGVRYTWFAFCFNLFGTANFQDIRLCFGSQRRANGTCR
jgi:hypothetical protein